MQCANGLSFVGHNFNEFAETLERHLKKWSQGVYLKKKVLDDSGTFVHVAMYHPRHIVRGFGKVLKRRTMILKEAAASVSV